MQLKQAGQILQTIIVLSTNESQLWRLYNWEKKEKKKQIEHEQNNLVIVFGLNVRSYTMALNKLEHINPKQKGISKT